jgi:serine protease SohB
MEQLIDFGLFAGKLVLILIFIGLLLTLIAGAILRVKHRPQLEFENLNEKFHDLSDALSEVSLDKKSLKKRMKDSKKSLEKIEKLKKKIFVVDFAGDITAKQVDELRDEVTTILGVAGKDDEVLVKIESPGGTVHGYGLAAAQLKRIKSAGLRLVTAVDKVAASGGYLMACTGNKIIASPFAIVGSIGVLAQVPNFHRLLDKNNIDYEEYTSGEYKRTVSLFGEITEKGKTKFTEQITDTHGLFKEFVAAERSIVNIEEVGTGEYWYGKRALELKLVDELKTSDDYLFENREKAKLISVKIVSKKSLSDKLSEAMKAGITGAMESLMNFKTGLF